MVQQRNKTFKTDITGSALVNNICRSLRIFLKFGKLHETGRILNCGIASEKRILLSFYRRVFFQFFQCVLNNRILLFHGGLEQSQIIVTVKQARPDGSKRHFFDTRMGQFLQFRRSGNNEPALLLCFFLFFRRTIIGQENGRRKTWRIAGNSVFKLCKKFGCVKNGCVARRNVYASDKSFHNIDNNKQQIDKVVGYDKLALPCPVEQCFSFVGQRIQIMKADKPAIPFQVMEISE